MNFFHKNNLASVFTKFGRNDTEYYLVRTDSTDINKTYTACDDKKDCYYELKDNLMLKNWSSAEVILYKNVLIKIRLINFK